MKNPVLASIALHLAVFIILLLDLPLWSTVPRDKIVPPPIIVDISKVKIAPETNLPDKKQNVKNTQKQKKVEEKPKLQTEKKDQKENEKKVSKPKKDTKVETVKKKNVQKPAPVKSPAPASKQKTQAKDKTGVSAPLKNNTVKNDKIKQEEKITPSRKMTKKIDTNDEDEELKSLLASLDRLEKEQQSLKTDKIEKNVVSKEEKEVTKGIKGGGIGDYSKELTISEQDALSSRLSACWNIDAGVKGAVDMVVEIQVSLRKDGSVNDVRIVDRARYNTDPSFRSVAESARRAVYICEYKKEDSPFKFLAVKYPEDFEVWKSLVLFFNPLDGGVR